jgi:UDPglucose--hexose-1-phosphate uridylyltransferase
MDYERPHRRLNILNGEWVLVSPHRAKRPWQGQVEKTNQVDLPRYDPTCYLCPRNSRVGDTITNPDYKQTFVFDNDFAALLPPVDGMDTSMKEVLFQAEADDGLCRVICFSPRHDQSLPELELVDAAAVVQTWSDQTADLGGREFINYVQVFENKGAVMGCSNPHPHSQVWATRHIPNEPAKEMLHQRAYFEQYGSTLLGDYLKAEQSSGERIVAINNDFTALVPFWAVWPFEVLVIAHRPVASLPELTTEEVRGMADILQQVTVRYDNLFEISFPYSMGFHQKPSDGKDYTSWQLHAHFYPPLLRSATVKKFMVGFEMLGMPQRDITPEAAAARLREQNIVHYKKRF